MSTIIRQTSFRSPISTSGPASMNHILHGSPANAEQHHSALPSISSNQPSPGYTPPEFLLPDYVPSHIRQMIPERPTVRSRSTATLQPAITLPPIRASRWREYGLPALDRRVGRRGSRLAPRLERAWASDLHQRDNVEAQHRRRAEDLLRRGLADIKARAGNLQDEMGLEGTTNNQDASVSPCCMSDAIDTANPASPVWRPPPSPRRSPLSDPEDSPYASRNRRHNARTDHD